MYCRKCRIEAADDAKICRSCGSILDEAPDTLDGGLNDFAVADSTPDAPYPMSWLDSPPEPIEAVAMAPAEFLTPPRPNDAPVGADWQCERCGSYVPWNYEVCWKCVTVDEELDDQPDLKEFLDQAEASQAPAVSTDVGSEAVADVPAESEPLQIQCPACGSARMMTGMSIQDQSDLTSGVLKIVVFTDPNLTTTPGAMRSELKADICGDCGHLEFRVKNPRQLYRHWQKSQS